MKFSWLSYIGSGGSSFSSSTSASSGSTDLSELLSDLSFKSVYSFVLATSTEALEHIIYLILVYLLVCLSLYKLTFLETGSRFLRLLKVIKSIRLPSKPAANKRVLFVTSHPDDECMFFGPLILALTKRLDCQPFVLCLSNGNFEKLGNVRRDELWSSCQLLGIPASNVILVNATHLPDDPNIEWKTESIAALVLNTVESLDIQAIFTFDRDGVSHHPNHCAVYYATASLCLANLLPKECKFYTLDSVNILRKYLSIFDLLCTCLMSTHWCILSWKEASIIRHAMREHNSQMKWFRWLYIYFSRYMFINSLREVNLADVELEMQIHEN
ncbi:N-acetylglucosaminyl-phosphatidylinositol de-N-acetylase isoform X2 [Eupeodes corollae]|uniref:N-acetylglucosaminyl-phosphatidylinositol de-N-acetylase isoform X2 n=1 Tax=Eupeodes corollae TaxID=290404 RepID=UPI002491A613|nr:N-acetylglucosaminyl-phosphatidylinositol de-N-acetylase isoform X2 [Eupeodes corollae]